MKNKKNGIVNVLWTGGWDSTFRLLQLVLIQKRIVQPYYLIDSDRRSSAMEMEAMDKIRKNIFLQHSYAKELILPTFFYKVVDIPENNLIMESFFRIQQKIGLGPQYEWLARFCNDQGLNNVDISIELSRLDSDNVIKNLLNKYVVLAPHEKGSFVCDEKFKGSDEYEVFHFFRMPFLNTTKMQMNEIAKKYKFKKLLNLTWFCQFPTKNGIPCGECKPCRIVQTDGLGWRIPIRQRLRIMVKKVLGQKIVSFIRAKVVK